VQAIRYARLSASSAIGVTETAITHPGLSVMVTRQMK